MSCEFRERGKHCRSDAPGSSVTRFDLSRSMTHGDADNNHDSEPRTDQLHQSDQHPLILDLRAHSNHVTSQSEATPQAREEERIDSMARYLTSNAESIQRGDKSYAPYLLAQIDWQKDDGRLPAVTDKLSKNKAATVVSEDGEITHIVFNGKDGYGQLDVNIPEHTINGKTAAELRTARNERTLEYVDASMKSVRPDEEQYSPDVIAHANKFAGAVLKNDLPAAASAYKEIADDPAMQRSVEGALDQGFIKDLVTFDPDNKTMAVSGDALGRLYGQGTVQFSKDGQPSCAGLFRCDAKKMFSSISESSGIRASLNLQGIEDALSYDRRLPAGAYPSATAIRAAELEWRLSQVDR